METIQAQLQKILDWQNTVPQEYQIAVVLGAAIFAIVYCFYGYRLMRCLNFIAGFVVGAAVGYIVAVILELDSMLLTIVPLVAGLAVGLLMYFLFRVGMFITVMMAGFVLIAGLLQQYTTLADNVRILVALGGGLVMAVLCVIFLRPITIIITSLSGGFSFAAILFTHLVQVKWNQFFALIAPLAVGLVLGIIGMICQFHRRK